VVGAKLDEADRDRNRSGGGWYCLSQDGFEGESEKITNRRYLGPGRREEGRGG
jgi:hypothetical protein